MCNCKSYNRPELGGEETMTIANRYGCPIAVDPCIADEVKALWANDIGTLGSCCGHNGVFERSIILADADDAYRAREIVKPETKLKAWILNDI